MRATDGAFGWGQRKTFRKADLRALFIGLHFSFLLPEAGTGMIQSFALKLESSEESEDGQGVLGLVLF